MQSQHTRDLLNAVTAHTRLSAGCGSHGLIGALFACFGKADQAIVLDKFKPVTFSNLCESLRLFLVPATSEHIQQGAASETPSKDELSRAVETLVVNLVFSGILLALSVSHSICA